MQAHSRTAMIFHWGFILVFVYALTKQLDEVEELEDFALLQAEMLFAGVFLLLLVGRFLYMQLTRPTALPHTTPLRQRRAARLVHLGMYAALAMIAVSGLVIGALYGSGRKTGTAMDAALLVHELAVHLTTILIVIHIAAALFHRRKRDGIWSTMVPVWREPDQP